MQDELDESDDGAGSRHQQEPEGRPHGVEEEDGSGFAPSSDDELADVGSGGKEEIGNDVVWAAAAHAAKAARTEAAAGISGGLSMP